MFKKLLFTDNCILNTKTNTAIFDIDPQWGSYIEWAEKNPIDDLVLVEKKQAKLNWNQGQPIKNGNVELKYNIEGQLYYKKVFDINGNLKTRKEYFVNGALHSTTYCRGYITIENKFTQTGDTSVLYLKMFKKNNKILKSIKYYNNSKQIHRLIKHDSYTEYYENGTIRSYGKLDADSKMDGEWNFYSRDGIIESSHRFKNGKLIDQSVLYNQLGIKNNIVVHD